MDFEKIGFFSNFQTIRFGGYSLESKSRSSKILINMYGPNKKWPSDAICHSYFGRNWFSAELSNGDYWQTSDYAKIDVRFDVDPNKLVRCVHIAYRNVKSKDGVWRFYGSVVSYKGVLRLYSEAGDYQEMPQQDPMKIEFRTYFGGRNVEFRIASLHSFTVDYVFPFNDKRIIGFEW